jgi:purine-nucleoside phosphorylase
MILREDLEEAVHYIRRYYQGNPETGIVLGTGLGELVRHITVEREIPYNFIPHFPISTVEGHFGKLIFGKIGGKETVAMQGRFHFYEGYSLQQIALPIRVMYMLGVRTLYLSNAAGAMNPDFKRGELMLIDDHINLLGSSPLIGPNDQELGPRFPDMATPYDNALQAKAKKIAEEENIPLHKGVYVCVPGPQIETRAEYRYLRNIGGDVVGMSTVPEVITAIHMGMKTCALSVLTDECNPDNLQPFNLEEILAAAAKAEPLLTKLLTRMIAES